MLTFIIFSLILTFHSGLDATKGQKIDKDEYPSFVCKIEFVPKDMQAEQNKKIKPYVCSGTLISSNLILTSAHCFTYKEKDTIKKAVPFAVTCPGTSKIVGEFKFSYDDKYHKEESKLVAFLTSKREESYEPKQLDEIKDSQKQLELMKTTTSHDLAMIQLPVELELLTAIEPVNDKDVEEIKNTEVLKRKCRIAGYAGAASKLRAGDIKIKGINDLKRNGITLEEAFTINKNGDYRYVAIPYDAPVSYTAPGDSGGPFYCKIGVNWKVLGITSSMSSPDDFMPWMLWNIPTEAALKHLKENLK